jgi:hypothetical protein
MIYHTQGKQANRYSIDAVQQYLKLIATLNSMTGTVQSET